MRLTLFIGAVWVCYWVAPILNAQEEEVEESAEEQLPTYSIYASLVFSRPQVINEEGSVDFNSPTSLESLALQVEQPRALELTPSLDRFNSSIKTYEQRGGAWDQNLAQELQTSGLLYQEQGEHLEAIDAFTRALQVNRINFGLDNLQQIPLVEQLIDSYLALGEWDKADQYHDYLYYTHRKALDEYDPRMLAVHERIANWSMNLFYLQHGEDVGRRLIVAYNAFRSASEIAKKSFGNDDDRYINFLNEMASTAFLVSVNRELMLASSRTQNPGQVTYYDTENARFGNFYGLNPAGFNEGLEALESVVESYRESGDRPLELADALTAVGDWHLMYRRNRTASNFYQSAYETLQEMEQGEELNRERFGNVIQLPRLTETSEVMRLSAAQLESQNRSGYLDVEFDVSNSGTVRNVEFLTEVSEETSIVQSRLRQRLYNSTFRPAVINGEMERKEANRFRYHYWY